MLGVLKSKKTGLIDHLDMNVKADRLWEFLRENWAELARFGLGLDTELDPDLLQKMRDHTNVLRELSVIYGGDKGGDMCDETKDGDNMDGTSASSPDEEPSVKTTTTDKSFSEDRIVPNDHEEGTQRLSER